MTRKSRKLRSSFYEVDYCGERLQACRFAPSEQWFWFSAVIMVAVDQGFISRQLSVIGMKVSFRNFDSQFISYCVLIQKS